MLQLDRGTGKSYTIMTEIHDHIVVGIPPSEILVVLPVVRQIHFWTREWEARFGPSVRLPEIMGHDSAVIRARGKSFRKMYFEDVNMYEDGIFDSRIAEVVDSLRSPFKDEEVVFTSSLFTLNQRTHSAMSDADAVLRKLLADRYARLNHA